MNLRSEIQLVVRGVLRGMLATLIVVCSARCPAVRADFSFDLDRSGGLRVRVARVARR